MSDFDNIGWTDMGEYLEREHPLNGAGMDTPNTPNFPYRLAHQMQEQIINEVAYSEYTVGRAERDDMAVDIANDWFNRSEFEPADIAFEALNYWRRIYGRGVQGDGR